ncbi:hypothetical protein GCM10023169_26940 [Georgenia halophila]|uniref:ATP/GTP-binding protein n=1 Tax=Georgenia halophila TaxID=620889 RepID=A0ABP8LCT3_9MICO
MSETTRVSRAQRRASTADKNADGSAVGVERDGGRDQDESKRRKERRGLFGAPPGLTPREEGLDPYNAAGTQRRGSQWLAARGYYAPVLVGGPTTTRQAEVLNTAVIAGSSDMEAPILGVDQLSDSVVKHDPFLAYDARLVTSPNVLLVGDVGSSKSSTCKTVYGLRPALQRDRRVVVFDKKERDEDEYGNEIVHQHGEYAQLVRVFGGEPITFNPNGGGVVLNVLDPVIAGTGNQRLLLMTVAELAQGGKELTAWEQEAIRSAHRIAVREAERAARVPVLPDVLAALGHLEDDPLRAYEDLWPRARERFHEAGIGVRFLLNGLLEEYGGLFDGETSSSVRLDKKITSFDMSPLPDSGPAVSIVMAIAHTWLQGMGRRRVKTNLIVEEGWHLVSNTTAPLLQENIKLSRARGIALIMAIHKIADIPTDSPAMAVLQEAHTVHIYSQSRATDVERCVHEFNLDGAALDLIPDLEQGFHLFKRGRSPEMYVQHTRSSLEVALTDTDGAMVSRREIP